ncbi:hypothetical protein H257_07398 [Aphanomyces astaci]|nr:hypothetical protein H257_07398 [Aphanomyces astaci]ETV79371.1 hypothetical protein H257_07398 [Aphanomyces astaci]|eukprot:XP_009831212.1 hypothetical protein H257_07398 [Aphanomyces astaci]
MHTQPNVQLHLDLDLTTDMTKKTKNKWLRELTDMMERHGFKLKRNENHLVWRNDRLSIQIATSSSPSDLNAIRQIERDIRRKLSIDHPWYKVPCAA